MSVTALSPSDIIYALLLQAALATAPSTGNPWPCYVSAMPDGDQVQNNVVTVYDILGLKEGRDMASGTVYERYGVQIKIRSLLYEDGWAQIQAVANYVDAMRQVLVNASSTQAFKIPSITRGIPISMGPEPGTKRRFLFSLNISFVTL